MTFSPPLYGYEIPPKLKYRISIVRDHLHCIEMLIERVDHCVNAMAEMYDEAISLLYAILGIDRSSAITVISKIGIYKYGSVWLLKASVLLGRSRPRQ